MASRLNSSSSSHRHTCTCVKCCCGRGPHPTQLAIFRSHAIGLEAPDGHGEWHARDHESAAAAAAARAPIPPVPLASRRYSYTRVLQRPLPSSNTSAGPRTAGNLMSHIRVLWTHASFTAANSGRGSSKRQTIASKLTPKALDRHVGVSALTWRGARASTARAPHSGAPTYASRTSVAAMRTKPTTRNRVVTTSLGS